MTIDFNGRVAVVTGAGNGIGASHARLLAARGAAVVVNDVGSTVAGDADNSSPADAVVAEIRAAGGTAIANGDTVATPEGGRAIVDAALSEFGRLDIVINNAGNRRNGPLLDVTPEDFEAVLAVHLRGAFYVTQPAFAAMKEQGYGRLLFTSSSAGLFGNSGHTTYGAAKGGVFGFAQSVAVEGEPFGIKSNVLLPMAATPRALSGVTTENAAGIARASSPAERGASSPELVSALAAYLVSEHCPFSHEIFASANGRYYSAFVGTTRGWFSATDNPPTIEEIERHLDEVRSQAGYFVPASLGSDIADSAVSA